MPETINQTITTRIHSGVCIVGFCQRRILEEALVSHIAEELNRLIDTVPPPRLLLDFESVDHLSSAALGMLIILNSNIRRRGGQLKMCRIRSEILEVFEITRLNKLFEIFDDDLTAVNSFSV